MHYNFIIYILQTIDYVKFWYGNLSGSVNAYQNLVTPLHALTLPLGLIPCVQ